MRVTEFPSLKKALSPKEKANRLRQLVDTAYERASKVNARIDAPLQNPENDPQLGSTDRCVRKKSYTTEDHALRSAAFRLSTADGSEKLRAYICKECEKWHLTSKAWRSTQRLRICK